VIDTVRFKVNLSKFQIQKIKEYSQKVISKKDITNDKLLFEIHTAEISLPSFNRRINIVLGHNDFVFIEYSVPKSLYNNNIFILSDITQFYESIYQLWFSLLDTFDDFPHCDTWEIFRLDVCTAWKFDSQLKAEKSLLFFSMLNIPRKKLLNYDGQTVMYKGSTESMKFYLKRPEYRKNDYNSICKSEGEAKANSLLFLSSGVLRFEITLRIKALRKNLKKDTIYARDLTNKKIYKIQYRYFKKIFSYINLSTMNKDEILSRLLETYKKQKALRLYNFYLTFWSNNHYKRSILVDSYSRQQIYMNKKALRTAKIGLPTSNNIEEDETITVPAMEFIQQITINSPLSTPLKIYA
jgi:hypothetical protein